MVIRNRSTRRSSGVSCGHCDRKMSRQSSGGQVRYVCPSCNRGLIVSPKN